MKMPKSLAPIFLFGIFACTTIPQHTTKDVPATIAEAEKLSIGRTTEVDLVKLFGPAPMQFANDKEGVVVWLYYLSSNPKRQRMNVAFDSKTHILKSVVWFVEGDEPEINLISALAHYPKSHFMKHVTQWQQDDYMSTQTTYVDNNIGVVIEVYEGHTAEVASLSWSAPGSVEIQDGFINAPRDSANNWRILVDNRKEFQNRHSANAE